MDEKLREEIALTPVSTHKYNGKRYLTLDGIDRIQALFTTRLEENEEVIIKELNWMAHAWEEWYKSKLDEAKKTVAEEIKRGLEKLNKNACLSSTRDRLIPFRDWQDLWKEWIGVPD